MARPVTGNGIAIDLRVRSALPGPGKRSQVWVVRIPEAAAAGSSGPAAAPIVRCRSACLFWSRHSVPTTESAHGCPRSASITRMRARTPDASTVTLHQLMLPEHANTFGNVHGGEIMKVMDEAGAICAMRHAHHACVTIAIDSMSFHSPVHVGQLLCCRGRVTWTGKTSIEVEVQVHAEDVIKGTVTHTNSGHFVYVALDDERRPTEVPSLLVETEADEQAFSAAVARRELRLKTRG